MRDTLIQITTGLEGLWDGSKGLKMTKELQRQNFASIKHFKDCGMDRAPNPGIYTNMENIGKQYDQEDCNCYDLLKSFILYWGGGKV